MYLATKRRRLVRENSNDLLAEMTTYPPLASRTRNCDFLVVLGDESLPPLANPMKTIAETARPSAAAPLSVSLPRCRLARLPTQGEVPTTANGPPVATKPW